MVIDSTFVYYFINPDLLVEIFFKNEEAGENGSGEFEIGDIGSSANLY